MVVYEARGWRTISGGIIGLGVAYVADFTSHSFHDFGVDLF